MHSFESHAEVISRRVERILLILHDGASNGIFVGDEDVQTSHARVTIGREIEVAIRTERREHLVTRCVDRTSEVLHATKATLQNACAPDVQTAFTTLCIADKIEPLTIGTDCWMCKGCERVARNHTFGWFAPRGIATLRLPDFSIARIVGIAAATREVHRLAVRTQT